MMNFSTMNSQKNRLRIVLLGWLLAFFGAVSFATTFSIGSGKRLLLNGQPFTIQGVDYSPTPVGYKIGGFGTNCIGPYQWWMDRPTYIADFPQIHRLGANTI